MASGYDDRRRDSNDYLDRHQDQADWAQQQRERTADVYDGLRSGNDFAVRCALDAPLADAARSQTPPRTLTAREQFREHSGALLFCLEWTDVFPPALLDQWRDHITALDIERPRASLRLLAALSESFDAARRRFNPPLLDLSRDMQFENQVPRIGREIDRLIRILEHVLAYEPAHPGEAISRSDQR